MIIDTMVNPSNNLAWRAFHEKLRKDDSPRIRVGDYLGALTVYGSESKFPKNTRDKFQSLVKTEEFKDVGHECRKAAARMGMDCFSDRYEEFFMEDIAWKGIEKNTLQKLQSAAEELADLKKLIEEHEIDIPGYDPNKKTAKKARSKAAVKKPGPAKGSQAAKKGKAKAGVKRKASGSHSKGTKKQKRKANLDPLDADDIDDEFHLHGELGEATDDEATESEDTADEGEGVGREVKSKGDDEHSPAPEGDGEHSPARHMLTGGKSLATKGPRKSLLLGDDETTVHDNADDYLEATEDADDAEQPSS